jgi:hypothetical protein
MSDSVVSLKLQVQRLEAEKDELSKQLLARDATISCLQRKNAVMRRALASNKEQENCHGMRRKSCIAAFSGSETPSLGKSRLTDGELHQASQLARQGRRAVKTLLEKLSRRDNPQQVGGNRAIVLDPDCSTYEAEVQKKAEHIRNLLADHLQGVDLEVCHPRHQVLRPQIGSPHLTVYTDLTFVDH